MKLTQEQIDDIIIKDNIIETRAKQELIINEYEKFQKNIQPIWIGEGWYKGVPNSFNYFASGFEAGMNYARKNK